MYGRQPKTNHIRVSVFLVSSGKIFPRTLQKILIYRVKLCSRKRNDDVIMLGHLEGLRGSVITSGYFGNIFFLLLKRAFLSLSQTTCSNDTLENVKTLAASRIPSTRYLVVCDCSASYIS